MIVSSLRQSTGLLWLVIAARARAADKRATLVMLLVLGFAGLLLLSEVRLGKQSFNLAAETEFVLVRVGDVSHATEHVRVGELRLQGLASAKWRSTGEPLEADGVTFEAEPGGRLTLQAIGLENGKAFSVSVRPDGWVQLDLSEIAAAPIVVTVEPPATMSLGNEVSALKWFEMLEVLPGRDFHLAFTMADERPLRLGEAVPIKGLSFDDDRDQTASPFSRLRSGVLQFDLWGGRPDTARELRDGESVTLSGLSGHLRHLVVVADEWEPGAARALQLQAVGEVSGAEAGFWDRRDRELRPNLLENLASIEFLRIFGGVTLSIGVALIGLWKLRGPTEGGSGTAGKADEQIGDDAARHDRDAEATLAVGRTAPSPDGVRER